MHCNVWHGKNLCGTYLCDRHLTRIICINKTCAEKCRFTVFEGVLIVTCICTCTYLQDLKEAFFPKYFIRCNKYNGTKKKYRDCHVREFSLQLTYRVIYGEATLCLCFDLSPARRHQSSLEDVYGQALVVSSLL